MTQTRPVPSAATTHASSRTASRWRRLLSAAVIAGAGLATGTPAADASAQLSAKVEVVDQYKIVTTDARALVRCGPGAAYYPVAEGMPVGTVLTADGTTSGGWLRVKYPKRAFALVDDESVTYESDRQLATLNRPATLSAFNAATGARGSWSKLLAEPLPAGTELAVIGEAFNDLTGERVGYQVEPPPEARAFVRETFTRRATSADLAEPAQADQPVRRPTDTPGEAAQPLSPTGATRVNERPTVRTPDNAVPPAGGTDAPGDQANPTETPNDGTPAESSPAVDPNRIDPNQVDPDPTAPSRADETVRPEGQETRAAANGAEPGPGDPDEPQAVRIETLEDLDAAFKAVQAQPLAEAEFDQLLAETDRMFEAEPAGSGLRPAIESRRSVLLIRKRVQDAWRENNEIARRAEAAAGDINNEIRRLEVERSYSAIGRLLPSAVYDGKRLPRMYRVQSVDTTEAPRTLGYLKPNPALGLESKLNQTVGVIGTPRLDPRLNLLVIEPIQIDVIGAGGGR